MELDIAQWYTLYAPMVMRRCRQLLRDEAAAADAMQDVFVQVLRKRDHLHADAPSSLLYTMATNICLNRLRDQRRQAPNHTAPEPLLQELAAMDDVEAGLVASDLLNRLFRRQLPTTRVLAVMHWHDGLTLEEVARHSGLSVSGVRKRLAGVRAKLKTLAGVD